MGFVLRQSWICLGSHGLRVWPAPPAVIAPALASWSFVVSSTTSVLLTVAS